MPTDNAMAAADCTTKHDPRRWARRCLFAYWAVLLLLMHYPMPFSSGLQQQDWDKVGHFLAYGIFTALLAWWVFAREWPPRVSQSRRIRVSGLLIVLGVMLYAVIDEGTQPLTGRYFDWWDWAVDAAASVSVGTLITILVLKRARRLAVEAEDKSP